MMAKISRQISSLWSKTTTTIVRRATGTKALQVLSSSEDDKAITSSSLTTTTTAPPTSPDSVHNSVRANNSMNSGREHGSTTNNQEGTPVSSSPSFFLQRYSYVVVVEDMMCQGCAKTVQQALQAMDGITQVSINLKQKKVQLWCQHPQLEFATVVKTLDSVGMTASTPPRLLPVASINSNNSSSTVAMSPAAVMQTNRNNMLELVSLIERLRNGVDSSSNTLTAADDDRASPAAVRRYQCGCGCPTCICSDVPMRAGDMGRLLTLRDICHRIEKEYGLEHMQAKIQAGGQRWKEELRAIAAASDGSSCGIPCGCSM